MTTVSSDSEWDQTRLGEYLMKNGASYLAATLAMAILLGTALPASAQTAPSLGSAQSFAVLAGSGVTNTGPTVVTGDLGSNPTPAITGFPPGLVVSGAIHAADAVALAAQNSTTTAYNNLAGQPCTLDLTGENLGGKTLTAGVYCFSSSAQLTGTLTLNAQGNSAAVFIFKIGSTLTTASAASVVVINGGSLCNIFWQVGSSATLGTNTSFAGNILALTSITLNTGTSVTGRTLARNGAVTLDSNAVTAPCVSAPPPPVCAAITLSPSTVPNGTVDVAYSRTLFGSGGTAPYTFTLVSGTLPSGVTLKPSGVLSGTPTSSGTFTFTIRGTDALGCFANITLTLIIAPAPTPPAVCPTITFTPLTLSSGTVAVAYNQTLAGSGGITPYGFGVTAGALPTGLTLTAAGVLSGTPLIAASSTFTIRSTDGNGCFAARELTIVIAAPVPPPLVCPVVTLLPPTLPDGRVEVAYSRTITGSGGTGPYAFGVIAGALPAGLTLTAGGVLSGTPTVKGTPAFTLRGTDSLGCFASLAFTIGIAPELVPPPVCPTIAISPSTLPNPIVGAAYSQTMSASGGAGPYSFGVSSGALPAGLTLTSLGVLSGTPTVGGTSTFTLRGTDGNGCFAPLSVVMDIPTAVPTLPEIFVVLLALGLAGLGYFRLRGRARAA